jgi:hypothetical protein
MLTQLVPEMNFSKFQKAVTVLLASELLNQRDIFLAENPGEEDRYKSDIEFHVSNGKFYSEDIAAYPLINVWVGAANPLNNTVAKLHGDWALHFDLFACRKTEQRNNGDVIDGDTGANNRLDYLISQVWYILEAQQNFWKGSMDFFSSCVFETMAKMPPEKIPAAVPAVMARLTYSLRTEDTKEILEGWDVNQFTAQLIANNKELTKLIINI